MSIPQRSLEVRCGLEAVLVQIFVACLARVDPDVLASCIGSCCDILFLPGNNHGLHQRQKECCGHDEFGEVLISAMSLHDQVPPAQTQCSICDPALDHSTCRAIKARSERHLRVFAQPAIASACSFVCLQCALFDGRRHCFCTFEILSAMPSVFRISGAASSIARGSWQVLQS